MRGRGWALLVWLSACQAMEGPLPEKAGPSPSLELASRSLELGETTLRFRERVRVAGFISIRLNDATEPLAIDVTTRAPACVGEMECLAASTVILHPGVWQQVPVAIELSAPGRVSRVVSFSSAERKVAGVSLEVIATGTEVSDCLVLDDQRIDFGTMERGCPAKERQVRITNTCFVPRMFDDLDVVPRTAPFSISPLSSLPRRLDPGQSWVGLVDFLGGEVGTHEADLHFEIDGMLGAVLSLRGVRTENGPREFTFNSPSRQVDLLVVLDSSPSFQPRRAAVEQRIFEDATNWFWYAGPLRVGLVGTSGPSLVWGPGMPIYENDAPGFETLLQDGLMNLPAGNEVEQCLGAAAQITGTANFWRPEARRLAVCVTDAPDQTVNASLAISQLADAGVRWEVIGPTLTPLTGCDVEGLDDGIHLAGTSALGGSVTSICDDWHLPQLPFIPPMPLQYRLPVTPVFPITVWADGQVVDPANWSWMPADRMVQVLRRPEKQLVVVEAATCSP